MNTKLALGVPKAKPRADIESRTQDLFLTKEVLYH